MFIIVFFVTLGILVLIHELGHFFAAKKFGIKVEEFGFGIPPRAWGKKIGETIYSLNWLPFGGFVRLLGEDETDKNILNNIRSFAHQSVDKRIIVVIAGVMMNLILAWILFWLILGVSGFKTQILLLSPHRFYGTTQSVDHKIVIGEVAQDSPAQKAGIKQGDVIVAFNDQFISDSEQFISQTKQKQGEKVKLTLSDLQQTAFRTVELVPRKDPPEGQGAIGILLGTVDIVTLHYNQLWQKILSGPIHSYNMLSYSMAIFSDLVASSIAKKDLQPVSQTVSGPIGIADLINQILSIDQPLLPFLNLLALLSLNLALINVLPFPGLDGGRLLFLLIEAAVRKKVNPVIERYVHTVGLVVLIMLIVLISITDIQKFIL